MQMAVIVVVAVVMALGGALLSSFGSTEVAEAKAIEWTKEECEKAGVHGGTTGRNVSPFA